MGIAASGVAGWMLWTRWENSQPKQEVQSKQPNDAPPMNEQIPKTSERATPQTSTTDSADSGFNALRDKRSNPTAAQGPKSKRRSNQQNRSIPAIIASPMNEPSHLFRGPGHGETFNLLFQAGQKAIDNGKANEMLSDLMRDKDADFYRLSRGHSEWNVLIEALRNSDREALKMAPHHH